MAGSCCGAPARNEGIQRADASQAHVCVAAVMAVAESLAALPVAPELAAEQGARIQRPGQGGERTGTAFGAANTFACAFVCRSKGHFTGPVEQVTDFLLRDGAVAPAPVVPHDA